MAENIDILVKLVDEATAPLVGIQNEMGKLDKSVQAASASVEKASVSMVDKLGGVANISRRAGTAFALAGTAIVAGVGLSVKNASDLGESVNAVNVIFKEASGTIMKFGDTSAQSAGLSRRAFFQAVTPIGAMLQNMGLSAGEAADQSVMLAQRAADMASVFNTDLGTALTAIQAGLRGEADPIEKFGVGLSETAVKAYAVSQGMIGLKDEMDAQTKVTARLGLFTEQTNKIAGDFANTSDGLANKSRILAADLENMNAKLGEGLKPILEAILKVIVPVIEAAGKWAEANPKLSQGIVILTAGLGALLVILSPVIFALGMLSTASIALGIGMLPIMGIMAAITVGAGLLIAAIYLIVANWDLLKAKTAEAWDWIKARTDEAITFVVEKATWMWNGLKSVMDGISEMFQAVWNGIKVAFTAWVSFIVGLVIIAFEAMGLDAVEIWNGMIGGISAAIDWARSGISFFMEWVSSAWSATWRLVSSVASAIWTAITNTVKGALSGIVAFFSPMLASLGAAWDGFWTSAGNKVKSAWEGIKATVKDGINWVLSKINDAIAKVNSVIAAGAGALGIKVITIPSIPLLAKGGDVVSAGSAMVGENGPEILSLPRGARVTPLDHGAGGGPSITINVNNATVMDADDVVEKIGNPIMAIFKQHYSFV